MDLYSTLDIMRILDLSRGKIREWVDGRFVVPYIKSSGQGERSEFNRWDLYGIKMFKEMVANGMSREKTGELYKGWKKHTEEISISDRDKILHLISVGQIESVGGDDAIERVTMSTILVLKNSIIYDRRLTGNLRIPSAGFNTLFEIDYGSVFESFNEWQSAVIVNMGRIIKEVDKLL